MSNIYRTFAANLKIMKKMYIQPQTEVFSVKTTELMNGNIASPTVNQTPAPPGTGIE